MDSVRKDDPCIATLRQADAARFAAWPDGSGNGLRDVARLQIGLIVEHQHRIR